MTVGRDGLIEAVAPTEQSRPPAAYRERDLTGRFVVPGLINAHAHLFSDGKPLPSVLTSKSLESPVTLFFHSPAGKALLRRRARTNALTQLYSGVTTLRTVGDVRYEVVALRDQIEAGRLIGPRIQASGPLLAVSGGHGAPLIALVGDDPWTARRNVRINVRKGVNSIKISATGGVTDARAVGEAGRPQMTWEELVAICEEAHSAGIVVAAHAQSREGVMRALSAGVDTIEHGSDLDDAIIALFKDNPRSLRGWSALIPTFQAAIPLANLSQGVTGVNDIVRANAKMVVDRMVRGAKEAIDNGVAVGMGSDSALTFATHYNAWRELDFAVRHAGLTPAQALHAATQANAEILGLADQTGSIAAGKAADLVVLSANPLDGFRAFMGVELVVARGDVIERPEISRFPEIEQHLDRL
ncbi:amidohydrolase family protein [Gryllotalpicola reticulitermitis]|uniref:Amidohydrolase family protein n=1 Tax=Gryllotalpicola reticulitermitis TaxID=1184153 RepID=A0ABV8Q5C3_9MICO